MPNDSIAASNAFEAMTKQKYLFPAEKLIQREWFQELQKPLNITVADIRRDFTKFIKDFPIEIIPHQSDEQLKARMDRQKQTMLNSVSTSKPQAKRRGFGDDPDSYGPQNRLKF